MSPLEAAIAAYNAAFERKLAADREQEAAAVACREAAEKLRLERLKVAQQRNKQ